MSFNINFNQPAIKGAQASQDGGAGNLGYMKGGTQQNAKKREESNSIFEDVASDTFVKSEQKSFTFDDFLDRIEFMIKWLIKKIFRKG